MKKILIINGPNLNLLGRREPEVYGTVTIDEVIACLRKDFPDIQIDYYQSNHEGNLIDKIQEAAYGENRAEGIVLNAGGYTHTSVALADAIAAIDIPVVEVHISNVFARESFRHHSLISSVCKGIIAGFGTDVYRLGVSALININKGI